MEILRYKDFEGSAELDLQSSVCRGRILFIDDLVTYESKTINNLQKQFENAVEDYIDTCAQVQKEPQKSCRGQFNVRVSPEMHRVAARRAIEDDTSLNDVVCKALAAYLQPRSAVASARMPVQFANVNVGGMGGEMEHRLEDFAVNSIYVADLKFPKAGRVATQFGSAAKTVSIDQESLHERASVLPNTWQGTSSAAAAHFADKEPPYAH